MLYSFTSDSSPQDGALEGLHKGGSISLGMEPNMGNRGEDIASKFEIPKQNPKCNEKNS